MSVNIWYDADLCNFTHRYQRNNKRGGLKNLRCFPTCAAEHKERGFCGRSVIVRAKITDAKNNENKSTTSGATTTPAKVGELNKGNKSSRTALSAVENDCATQCWRGYVCIGEFIKNGEDGLVKLNEKVSVATANERLRSKREPIKPWVLGEVIEGFDGAASEGDSVVFEFNKDRKGWHYGWASNKHTCNAQHCLQTYLFSLEKGQLKCIQLIRSIPFMLFCRRRRRFICVPSAPISPPKKRKSPAQTKSKPSQSSPKKSKVKSEKPQQIKTLDVDKIERVLSGIIRAVSSMPRRSLNPEPLSVSFTNNSSSSALGGDEALLPTGSMANEDSLHDSLWDVDILDSIAKDNNEVGNGLLDFSTSMSDCLDFFSSNTELDVKFDFTEDIAMNSHSEHITPIEREAIIEDLAEYLLHETSFTRSINNLRDWIGSKKSEEEGYRTFINVLEKNLSGFMKKHNLTKDQLNQVFQIQSDAVQNNTTQQPSFLSNVYESFRTVVSGGSTKAANADIVSPTKSTLGNDAIRSVDAIPRVMSNTMVANLPDHSGKWVRSGGATREMEALYCMMNMPWLLGKMMIYMEQSFEILQEGIVMSCRLRKKLLSNGAVKLILDGVERPFGFQLPILTTLSRNWTNCAFANGNTITAIHTFGEHRLMRVTWLSEDRNTLHHCVSLEVFDAKANAFVEKGKTQGYSTREL